MKYPLVLIVPFLMLLDYFLTLLGSYFFRTFFGDVRALEYELNPSLKKSIEKLHIIDFHHILSAAVITVVLIIVSEKNLVSLTTLECIVGLLALPLAGAVGRHLANILTVKYALQHPGALNVEMYMTHSFSVKMSQYHMLFLLVPLIVLAYIHPAPVILGGIVGIALLILWHQLWLKRN